MAYDIQQAVIDFHRKFGHPVRDTPQQIDKAEVRQAFGFIEEELDELYAALRLSQGCGPKCCGVEDDREIDLVESADAIGDIIVTAVGLGVRLGVDTNMILKAIMDSNMTKEANGMGKIKKGADYQPPKISEALGL